MGALKPLPLPPRATFADLIFRPHPDGREGHFQALYSLADGKTLSITNGSLIWDNAYYAPYEAMLPDGNVREYLTSAEVTKILAEMTN